MDYEKKMSKSSLIGALKIVDNFLGPPYIYEGNIETFWGRGRRYAPDIIDRICKLEHFYVHMR